MRTPAGPGEPGAQRPAVSRGWSWRALRHPNYRLYFGGQAISLLGTWIQQVALGWLVYRLTGSPLLLGTVAFLSQAPQLVGAPLAGIVSDRSDRRRLMLAVQSLMLAQALILAVLSRFGWIQPWHILLASLALGLLNCFDAPLRHALAAQLVADRNDLPNAIALNALTFNLARFVGPPLAGFALGLTSEATCFALNGLSFAAVIAALLRMRITPVEPVTGPFAAALREGLRFTRDNLPVRMLLRQVALLNFLAAAYVPLMPAFARDVFRGGPDTLGLLLESAGGGALCAALYMVSRHSVRGLTATIAGGNAITALSLIGFSQSGHLWLGIGLLFLLGFGLIVSNASTNTILQTILPDALRGRVLAVYAAATLGSAAAGGLVAGLAAERVGVQTALLGAGLLLLVAMLHLRRRLPRLREHLRPLFSELGVPPRGASTADRPGDGR